MRIDRRTMLRGSALAGAAVAIPASAAAMAAAEPHFIVFDSRIAESADFGRTKAGAAALDLAGADADQWRALRALSGHARIEGLTRWSDWVAVRGVLEEKGLRLAGEMRADAPISGRDHLFRWSMMSR